MDCPVIEMTSLKGAYEVSLLPGDLVPFMAKLPLGAPNGAGIAADPIGNSTIPL
jgi:hypothetical protein